MVAVVNRRILAVLSVAIAVVASMAGCRTSNGGDIAPQDYAKAVCAGLLSWRQGVTNDSAELSRQLQAGAADVGTVKTKYTRFFQGAVRRTDVLLTAVDRAGEPKVDEGLSYARDLQSALTQARTGLATAQRRFAALPTNNLRSYAAGAAKIRDDLGTIFVGVGAALDRLGQTYPDKGLNEAFEQQPDCKSLA
jgi:hypothetical protein